MKNDNETQMNEIKDMIRILMNSQQQLMNSINELKAAQEKMLDELKFQNYVLNSITTKNEVVN